MTLAMRLVAPGMSAAAGTTSFETSGILPAIGFNGLSPRFALAPGPVIAPLMTTPLPMTKAAELTIPDIAPSGKVFYQGSPDCAESSAPGKTKMSIAEDLQAETHYSLKEVKEILQAFLASHSKAALAQKTRLNKIARRFAHNTSYDYEDMLQEARTRVLEGRRKWPRDVDLVTFLAGVMRSIASQLHDKNDRPSDDADPDTVRVDGRSILDIVDAQKKIALFEGDPDAQKLLIEQAQGWRGEELRDRCGLSETEYENTRKRIQRRLAKLAPNE
jgi:DNA-directed RNA polymerase specialized sigma24 family protein